MTRRRKPKKKSSEHKKINIPIFLSVLTIHHYIPMSRGGVDSEKNTIEVYRCHHMAWHGLFKAGSYDLTPFEVMEVVKKKTFSQITKGKNVLELYWSIVFGMEIFHLEKKLIELEKMEGEGIDINKDRRANRVVYFLMDYLIKNEGIKRGAYNPSELKNILKEILNYKKIKIIENFWLPEKEEDRNFISDNPVTKIPDYLEFFK